MSLMFHADLDHLIDVIADLRRKDLTHLPGPERIELAVAVGRATRMLEAFTKPVITREMMEKATANIRAKVAAWRAEREAKHQGKGV